MHFTLVLLLGFFNSQLFLGTEGTVCDVNFSVLGDQGPVAEMAQTRSDKFNPKDVSFLFSDFGILAPEWTQQSKWDAGYRFMGFINEALRQRNIGDSEVFSRALKLMRENLLSRQERGDGNKALLWKDLSSLDFIEGNPRLKDAIEKVFMPQILQTWQKEKERIEIETAEARKQPFRHLWNYYGGIKSLLDKDMIFYFGPLGLLHYASATANPTAASKILVANLMYYGTGALAVAPFVILPIAFAHDALDIFKGRQAPKLDPIFPVKAPKFESPEAASQAVMNLLNAESTLKTEHLPAR